MRRRQPLSFSTPSERRSLQLAPRRIPTLAITRGFALLGRAEHRPSPANRCDIRAGTKELIERRVPSTWPAPCPVIGPVPLPRYLTTESLHCPGKATLIERPPPGPRDDFARRARCQPSGASILLGNRVAPPEYVVMTGVKPVSKYALEAYRCSPLVDKFNNGFGFVARYSTWAPQWTSTCENPLPLRFPVCYARQDALP